MQPLVSFIVPVYNLPVALVEECLLSIMSLSLTDEEREVIVVDDGSAERYDDKLGDLIGHISYFRTENQGLGPARNFGVTKATGKYIQFVDGDDALIPVVYDKIIRTIEEQKADVLMFGMKLGNEMPVVKFTNEYSQSKCFSQKTTGADFMLNNNLRGAACGYIFRRDILGSLSFNNIICEDEEFTPQLVLKANTFIKTDLPAYFYRQREGSIINNTDNSRQQKRFNDVVGVIVRLKELSETMEDMKHEALSRRVAQLTMDYIYNQWRYRRSLKQLKLSLQQLREKGLYPLSSEYYTFKYTVFRLLLKLL